MNQWARRFWTSLWIIELTSIIHDQFSVHICPEYWRPPHHDLLFGEPPTIILGLLWGVYATIWFAVPGAALLAWAGKTIEFTKYRRAMIRICLAALSLALLAWLGIFSFATFGPPAGEMIKQGDRLLMATAVMHMVSYSISFLLIIFFTILWKVRATRSASD